MTYLLTRRVEADCGSACSDVDHGPSAAAGGPTAGSAGRHCFHAAALFDELPLERQHRLARTMMEENGGVPSFVRIADEHRHQRIVTFDFALRNRAARTKSA